MAEYLKPIPPVDTDNAEFWAGCHRHELLMQKCAQCNEYRYPPRPICPKCLSMNFDWIKMSGKGEIYSFTIVRRPLSPEWETDIPYTIGVVKLDEGPRMVSNIVGCKPEDIKIGMKVAVIFDDVTADITLPKFKPAG
jgi:uncharacterized protein